MKGEYFAITTAILWGGLYPVAKYVLHSVPENQFILIRFLPTAAALLICLLLQGERLGVERADFFRIMLLGLLGVGCYQVCWTLGVFRTTAANASLLISTSPAFTGLYATLSKQERVGLKRWAGTALALIGIFFIIYWTPGSKFSISSANFVGNIIVLLGAIFFSIYAIMSKPLLEIYSPTKLAALVFSWGLMVLVPFSLLSGPVFNPVQIAGSTWLGLGYIIVLGTIIPFTFWFRGIKQTSPVRTVAFHNLVPVISVLLGVLWLREQVDVRQILGALLVIFGLTVANLKTNNYGRQA
jgi:drug/metabolite transporter (DMT)-like permease